jgi:hypothetical protein
MRRVQLGFCVVLASGHLAAAAPQSKPAIEGFYDVCPAASMSPDVRKAHLNNDFLRHYDRNCNGLPDKDELDARDRDLRKHVASSNTSATAPPAWRASAPQVAPAAGTARAEAKSSAKADQGCPQGFSGFPFVRDKYSDIAAVSTSDCSVNLQKLGGALFSWSNDRIANNQQWSATGLVGAQFFWVQQPPDQITPYVNIFSVAPLVRFQRVTNSKLTTKDIDVLSPGISGEVLIDRAFVPDAQLYVRGRGNVNTSFAGITNSWSGTFEVQPVYDRLHIGTPIPLTALPSNWTFMPLARAQYFGRVNNSTDPLFLRSDRVFRAGPSIALVVTPFDGPPVPDVLRKIVFSSSYTWYRDFIQTRNFVHYDLSLAYNITDNFGVKVTYEKGQIDESGKDVNLTYAGLTVKF